MATCYVVGYLRGPGDCEVVDGELALASLHVGRDSSFKGAASQQVTAGTRSGA